MMNLMILISLMATAALPESLFAPETCLVPAPAKLERGQGTFPLNNETRILFSQDKPGAEKAAQDLATLLRPATGYAWPVSAASTGAANAICLQIEDAGLGAEGYRLSIAQERATLAAQTPAGPFYGVQTLR